MQTAANLTADALRENVKSLNEVIAKIRGLHRGRERAPKASARYLSYIRACHELREAGVAHGATGPLFEDMQPIPYRDQLVGHTAEQRKALEWKGVNGFPFRAPAPVVDFQFLQAAE